jgi:hypothetical protein
MTDDIRICRSRSVATRSRARGSYLNHTGASSFAVFDLKK